MTAPSRRRVISLLGAGLACGLAARVARAGGGRRVVAYLDIDRPGARRGFADFVRALDERRLRERFGFDPLFVAVDQSRAEELAGIPARLRRMRPYAVVATSMQTALAVKALGVPALFFAPLDPVAFGLVPSLRRPGGTMTGYASRVPPVGKMLELLGEALPAARRVGVVADARFFSEQRIDRSTVAEAGGSLGFIAEPAIVEEREEFDDYLAQAVHRLDALLVPYTKVPFLHGEHVVARLKERRLPAVLGSARLVRAGGLVGMEPDYADADAVFARQLEAIALGTPPGEIPVERSRLFRVVVNLASAREIGVRLPLALVKRADVVLP
jgi:putative ABC transport system substrate-binding protein